MTRIVILIGLLLFSNYLFGQELTWKTELRSDGNSVVFRAANGLASLEEVINSIPLESWIIHFSASDLLDQVDFQNDVFSYLQNNYPDELAKALASAGNMHNPAVKQLREPFKAAVLNSTYVEEINKSLSNRCEKVTEVIIEKFFINKKVAKPKLESFLWLGTEKCT